MGTSLEAIKRVIAAFERSDWTEIDVRHGDVRVHLAAGAPTTPSSRLSPTTPGDVEVAPPPPATAAADKASPATASPAATPPATTTPPTAGSPAPTSPAPISPAAGSPVSAAAGSPVSALPPGAHLITAPSPGIFWCSPEPGAPPFAAVGGRVEESSTVCIIEVMKLMNHVKAGVGGDVVAAYGTNGVAVAKGEPLFAIVATDTAS